MFNYIIVLIRGIANKIKTLHERIKQINPSSLKDTMPSDPYSMLICWLIDNLTFGILSTIAINAFIGWQGTYNIGLVIGISISRQVIPEAITKISESIKGN